MSADMREHKEQFHNAEVALVAFHVDSAYAIPILRPSAVGRINWKSQGDVNFWNSIC
jgi:hypothetical protein